MKGELFLCPDRDEFRFPKNHLGSRKYVSWLQTPSRASCTARSNRLSAKPVITSRKRQSESTRKNSQKAAADVVVDSDNKSPSIDCTSCMNIIDTNCVKVARSICCGLFHFSGTGVQD